MLKRKANIHYPSSSNVDVPSNSDRLQKQINKEVAAQKKANKPKKFQYAKGVFRPGKTSSYYCNRAYMVTKQK